MIRELIRRLGLDKIGVYIEDEVRKARLQALQEERSVLLRIIEGLDERLAKLGGTTRAAKRSAPRKRAKAPGKGAPRFRKPGETLKEMAVKALQAAKKPLAVDALRAQLMKLGYKSAASASNLRISIFKALGDKKLFKKVEAGVYKLAASRMPSPSKAAAVNAPKSKRAAKRKEKRSALRATTTPAKKKAQQPKPLQTKATRRSSSPKPAEQKPTIRPSEPSPSGTSNIPRNAEG